jgi:hypothetical protein
MADKPAEENIVPDGGAKKMIDWGILLTVIVRRTWGASA